MIISKKSCQIHPLVVRNQNELRSNGHRRKSVKPDLLVKTRTRNAGKTTFNRDIVMKVFDHPNLSHGWKCPICKTSADQPVTLVGIPGTGEGNIMEAQQVHAECFKVVMKMNDIFEGE